MTFQSPWLLLLLLPLLLGAVWQWRRPASRPTLLVASGGPAELASGRRTLRLRLRWLPSVLRLLALLLIVGAIARPRQGLALTLLPEDGIDVVVALDVSSSMTERVVGATETKLAVAQRVVQDFVGGLRGDRVGLVIFQARALTLAPLTLDERAVARAVRDVRSGLLPDGTAIGLGLGESLNLLRESPAKSRVVVLLTDGQNNTGEIDPFEAAALAKALDVRVYTIGFVAGRQGAVDAAGLARIAETTGARSFDASTTADLEAAYDEIGRLERSRVGERRFTRYRELAPLLASIALGLLLAETALRSTWLRTHP